MSERLIIAAAPRTVIGKKVKQLRRTGYIPAVIYGQGEPEHIQLENLSLRRVLRQASTTHLIDLDLGTQVRTVLAREIQAHLTRGDLLHIDFYEVNMAETITSEAALIMGGQSVPGERGDGRDVLLMHNVAIECLPDKLVSEIMVDMGQIKTVDDVIYVKDIALPEGVTILSDPQTAVARFVYESLAPEIEETIDLPAADAVNVVGKVREEAE